MGCMLPGHRSAIVCRSRGRPPAIAGGGRPEGVIGSFQPSVMQNLDPRSCTRCLFDFAKSLVLRDLAYAVPPAAPSIGPQ